MEDADNHYLQIEDLLQKALIENKINTTWVQDVQAHCFKLFQQRTNGVSVTSILDVETHFRGLVRKIEEYYTRRMQKLEFFIQKSLEIDNNHRLLRMMIERIERYKFKKPWRLDDHMIFTRQRREYPVLDEKNCNQLLPIFAQGESNISGTSTPFSHYSNIPSAPAVLNESLNQAVYFDDQALITEQASNSFEDFMNVSFFFEEYERLNNVQGQDARIEDLCPDSGERMLFDFDDDDLIKNDDEALLDFSDIKGSAMQDIVTDINFDDFLSSLNVAQSLPPQSALGKSEQQSQRVERLPCEVSPVKPTSNRYRVKSSVDRSYSLTSRKSNIIQQTVSTDNLQPRIKKKPFNYQYLPENQQLSPRYSRQKTSQVKPKRLQPEAQNLNHRSNIYRFYKVNVKPVKKNAKRQGNNQYHSVEKPQEALGQSLPRSDKQRKRQSSMQQMRSILKQPITFQKIKLLNDLYYFE